MSLEVSGEYQLDFLRQLQRLFNEGEFVATYKFALLHALADICVEHESEADGTLHVPLRLLGEKFIELYWHHAAPYGEPGGVLRQNLKGQAEMVSRLERLRETHKTLAECRRSPDWKPAITFAAAQIRKMPLWRLQTLGGAKEAFLYEEELKENGIRLKPGVAACLRNFYPLVLHLVRGHWVAHIRRIPANGHLVGPHADLEYFLFGTQRKALHDAVPVLQQIQHGACFYCGRQVGAQYQVDHFVPWARYPRDLGHNFVLAHAACNMAKSDTLAARIHVERWRERNADHGALINEGLGEVFLCDEAASRRIARWSYELDASSSAKLWVKGRQYEPFDPAILSLL